MTQYPQNPSPYQPPYTPDYHFGVAPDPLSPARRAGTLEICLGALALLFGACTGSFLWGANIDQILASQNVNLPPSPTTSYTSVQLLKMGLFGMTIAMVFVGLVMIVLGLLVRRGNRTAIFTSMILCGVLLGLAGIQIFSGVVQLVATGMPQVGMGLCMMAVPVAMMLLLMQWLRGAARSSANAAALQMQQAAAYWQYQQSLQGGYGYPVAAGAGDPNAYPPAGYATGYPPTSSNAPGSLPQGATAVGASPGYGAQAIPAPPRLMPPGVTTAASAPIDGTTPPAEPPRTDQEPPHGSDD